MGVPSDVIGKLVIEALRVEAGVASAAGVILPDLRPRELPAHSVKLTESTITAETIPAFEYIYGRGLSVTDYNFYYSPSLPNRVIVPFYHHNQLVGWTARLIVNTDPADPSPPPKYLAEQTPGYVFNLDRQCDSRKYVVAVEGVMDAMSIDGVAYLGAEISDGQAFQIEGTGKDPILLPDRDKSGMRTINQVLERNWAVTFPDWGSGIKDANDAVKNYGTLYTLWSVLTSVETNPVKIRLKAKQWINR